MISTVARIKMATFSTLNSFLARANVCLEHDLNEKLGLTMIYYDLL